MKWGGAGPGGIYRPPGRGSTPRRFTNFLNATKKRIDFQGEKMNKLKSEKQESAIAALVEGASIRSVERMTGIHRDTIMRLLVRTGENCKRIMDKQMKGLTCERLQLSTKSGATLGRSKNRWGLLMMRANRRSVESITPDADAEFVPSYVIGKRTSENAFALTEEFAARLTNRVQISTDSLRAYIEAVDISFGGNVDYGQIVKCYEADIQPECRYSPPKVVATKRSRIFGNPDAGHISTSYVEKPEPYHAYEHEALDEAYKCFRKKLENLQAAVAVHFAYYNFVRIHKTLKVTPAIAAGVTERLWSIKELLPE